MSRSESFAIGAAMVTVALTVLTGSQKLAWGLLVVGSGVIALPYFFDWRYGKDRPSREEIDVMPKDEFKKRLRNPKFKRWVDHRCKKPHQKTFDPNDW